MTELFNPVYWAIAIIGGVGAILMTCITVLLGVIWNGIVKREKKDEERQKELSEAIQVLSTKIDDKVKELTACLTEIEEEMALNEQSVTNLVSEFGKMRTEIAELKKQMDSISLQYTSLKENHGFLRMEQDRQSKKIDELEKKINEIYIHVKRNEA